MKYNHFEFNKIYSEGEISEISRENNMITVDCLKDDNQITIEPEGGDTVYEFTLFENGKFKLTWKEEEKQEYISKLPTTISKILIVTK